MLPALNSNALKFFIPDSLDKLEEWVRKSFTNIPRKLVRFANQSSIVDVDVFIVICHVWICLPMMLVRIFLSLKYESKGIECRGMTINTRTEGVGGKDGECKREGGMGQFTNPLAPFWPD